MTHTPPPSPLIVGGGAKKVLYTLKTLSRIGLKQSAKALTSRNTCKACGLGMGGQRGGMTNEMGEFPSVCNKSIQAQSTDIQPPIPEALFAHSLHDFNQLSAQELEHLGRLNTPLYKAAHAQHYTPLDWPSAIAKLQNAFARTAPERSFFMPPAAPATKPVFCCNCWRAFMAATMSIIAPTTATKPQASA